MIRLVTSLRDQASNFTERSGLDEKRRYFNCSCVVCALQEDIKTLSTHVVENFQKELEGVKYVKTFETLKLRYDQQQDRLKDRMNMEGYVWLVMREKQRLCRLTLSG